MIKFNPTNDNNGKQIRKDFNYNLIRRSFHLTNAVNQYGLFKFSNLQKEQVGSFINK